MLIKNVHLLQYGHTYHPYNHSYYPLLYNKPQTCILVTAGCLSYRCHCAQKLGQQRSENAHYIFLSGPKEAFHNLEVVMFTYPSYKNASSAIEVEDVS